MDFLQVIKNRHSTRKFQNKLVEPEKIEQVLEATNQAPSAHNLQSYKIYVVKNQTVKDELTKAAKGQSFISQAGVVLVFVATPDIGYPRSDFYSLQDGTIACYQAWLAAVNLGLSAVWVGAFVDNEVAKVLKLKIKDQPIAILPIGYAGETPAKTPRKRLKELVIEI